MKNIFIILLLSAGVICGANGQDIIFSQYYSNPIHYNSAFAGTVTYPRFSANYRLQWPGFNNVYETYSASYDQHFPDKNLSVGAIVLTDDQGSGTLRQTSFKGIVSYNLRFGDDWQIKFGIGTALVQNSLDWDKLIFFDQLDPVTGARDALGNLNLTNEVRPANLSRRYLDVDLGMLLYNPRYYIGFSMFHANGPYNGFSPDNDPGIVRNSLPVLISLHAGYQWILQKDNKGAPTSFISPNILFTTQAGFTQFNVGAYLQKNQVFGGLWLRHTIENIDAVIFSFGVSFGNFKVGYSYDMTASNLSLATTRGSHEIGITLGLKHLEKKVSKLNDCFSLFR